MNKITPITVMLAQAPTEADRSQMNPMLDRTQGKRPWLPKEGKNTITIPDPQAIGDNGPMVPSRPDRIGK
jgi:hypothetical protein